MSALQPHPGKIQRKTLPPIRVMLVDDSIVARSIFARVLGQHVDIEIVCEAEDSEMALACLDDYVVDIILLDIEMPKRSGLDALPEFRRKQRVRGYWWCRLLPKRTALLQSMHCRCGACDTLAKPGRSGFSGRFSEILIDKVIRLGRSARERSDAGHTAKLAVNEKQIVRPACIAMGASTGGIPAIYEVVRNLDPSLDCPIFITQHLPEAFMSFFARQLASLTDRTVKVAESGEIVLREPHLRGSRRCTSGVSQRAQQGRH